MIWKGKSIADNKDFMDAFVKVSTKEEAQEFLALVLAENPHARENIGYMAGYFDNETKQRVYALFGVEHPIFGKLDPTFSQAMASGVAHGMAREQGKSHQEVLKFAHEVCALPDEEAKKWLAENCEGSMKRIPEHGDRPCDFDHNGECLVCDCWPSDCAFDRLFSGDFKYETLEELLVMFQECLTSDEAKSLRENSIEGVRDVNGTG